MLRSWIGFAVAACVAVHTQPQRPPADVTAAIDRVFASYSAGDDLAVERWVKDERLRAEWEQAHRAAARHGWSRARAAFVLELAAALPETHRRLTALRTGLDLISSRGAGTSPDGTFDALYHAAAVAIAQDTGDFGFQRDYLSRIGEAAITRFHLARGIAEAGACCFATGGRAAYPSTGPPATLSAALRYFESAAASPDVRSEALVRGGIQLYWSRDYARALDWLERAPAAGDDALIAFARYLFLARTFDALRRPNQAVAAYEAAAAARPQSQLPGIGLSAALLRLGRRDDAVRVASTVKATPADSDDPLVTIDHGDARFLTGWMARIRKARRAQ